MYATTEPTNAGIGNPVGDLTSVFTWFGQYWWAILLILGFFGAVILVIVLTKSREEERLERDSEGYKYRNQLFESAKINADKKKIRKKYSLLNLLWLGIPFKRNEHSAKVTNYEGKIIGFYRGESSEQNGFENLLLYKTSSFIFFENKFLLRFPRTMNISWKDDNDETKTKKLDLYNDFMKFLPNGDIQLLCAGIEKAGTYYFIPQFILNIHDNKRIFDIRDVVENSIKDSYFQMGYNNLLQTFSEQTRQIVKLNPYAKVKNEIGEVVQNNEEVEVEKRKA